MNSLKSKICFKKKTGLIIIFIIGFFSLIFFSYSINNKSHIIDSKATYKPPNNIFLPFIVMGLKNYISETAFISKYNTLTKLIDDNPPDETLKQAFSAFINSHIAIAGAYLKGSRLASDNMRHYIYGNGKNRDISDIYKKIGIDNYGTLGGFMTFQISFGLNNRKSLTTFSAVDISDMGFTKKTAKQIQWNKLDVLVDSQSRGLETALGRHTLSSSSDVVNSGVIVSDQTTIQRVSLLSFMLSDIKKSNTPYYIEQVTVKPKTAIKLYDKYVFNKKNSGAGAYAESSELKYVMDIITKTSGFGDLSIYMDKKSFDELKKGIVALPVTGLKKLEDLKIASSYSINATLESNEVGTFPVYLVIRE